MSIPFKKALSIIFLSTFCISGIGGLGVFYYSKVKAKWGKDPKYHIVALAQTTLMQEPLKTAYLEELLNLSFDQPSNLYLLNIQTVKELLLQSPLIKKAEVKKIFPGTLLVEYVARTPIAYLADYSNTALDADGVPIPFKPFFTPKNIPEIYLGLEVDDENKLWGQVIEDPRKTLSFDVLNWVYKNWGDKRLQVKRIDTSRAYSSSYGDRQIIMTCDDILEECTVPLILRLHTQNYLEGLANFKALREYLLKHKKIKKDEVVKPLIIDLRLSQLAFLKE